jgi:hypothetical protein
MDGISPAFAGRRDTRVFGRLFRKFHPSSGYRGQREGPRSMPSPSATNPTAITKRKATGQTGSPRTALLIPSNRNAPPMQTYHHPSKRVRRGLISMIQMLRLKVAAVNSSILLPLGRPPGSRVTMSEKRESGSAAAERMVLYGTAGSRELLSRLAKPRPTVRRFDICGYHVDWYLLPPCLSRPNRKV